MSKLYYDVWDYDDPRYPFQLFVGGYGTGKSYSGMYGALKRRVKMLYMRRTDATLEDISSSGAHGDAANPFNPINANEGTNIGIYQIKKHLSGIFERQEDSQGNMKPSGLPLGLATSLYSLAKIRGAGLNEIELIFFDEFIKEQHEKRINGEFKALIRGYETVNRNREFEGKPPCRLWAVSNAEDIYNDIFKGFGIVADVERAIHKGIHDIYFPKRRLAVHLVQSSEDFLEKKKNTAVMQLMEGTQYYDVALNNQFANNDFSNVRYLNIRGWRPVAALDNAYIYRKKGERKYYISYAPAQCQHYSSSSDADSRLFRRMVGCMLVDPYTRGEITFESYELKALILDNIF